MEALLPALFVVAIWWFATRLILVLDRLPRSTYRRSMWGAVAAATGALVCIALTASDTGQSAAYLAFSSAIVVWGLPELGFLTGVLTGSRRHACPRRCGGIAHFRHAIEAILYNELAIAALATAIVGLTWHAQNRVAAWTFCALWSMRASTKLNLFFGVRNWSEKLLPDHLRYLESFFKKQPMNLLFPLSVTAATGATWTLVSRILDPATGGFDATGLTLVATLLALGVLEHWFLVLPIPVEQLFGWGIVPLDDTKPAIRANYEDTPPPAAVAVPPHP